MLQLYSPRTDPPLLLLITSIFFFLRNQVIVKVNLNFRVSNFWKVICVSLLESMLDSWFFLRTDSWALSKLTKSESLVWDSKAQECVSPQKAHRCFTICSYQGICNGLDTVWVWFLCWKLDLQFPSDMRGGGTLRDEASGEFIG